MKSTFAICLLIVNGIQTAVGIPAGDRAMHPAMMLPQVDTSTFEESNEPMHGFIEGDTYITNWDEHAKLDVSNVLKLTRKINTAKNVILFVGDGMGVTTTSMARIFKSQQRGVVGNAALLSWEHFPYSAFSRTYDTEKQVADSAPTATAMVCGVKAKSGTIGVNQHVPRGDCGAVKGNEAKSFLKYQQDAGKWTGIVSTARITHATPAASYASSADRNWESDADLVEANITECEDIATQLIDGEYGKKIKVILGGGRQNFYPNTMVDPEYTDENGTRLDGRNLTQDWIDEKVKDQNIAEEKVKYVYDQAGFDAVDGTSVEYLMGLFEPSHMQYEADRRQDEAGEPSLAEMVHKSLDVMMRSPDGYFLFVEGGRIDHAHHNNRAYKALNDTLALQDAVEVAVSRTSEDDTLIIVTADHSHAFAFAGYASLPSPVLGVADPDEYGMPYVAPGYHNGPGFEVHRLVNNTEVPRKNLTGVDVEDPQFVQDAGIYRDSETHGGEDVAIYARGPMAHMFHGTHEQNYIAYVMMYASCTGVYTDNCYTPQPECVSSARFTSWSITTIFFSLFVYVWSL